jgi:hypothetical protein
MYGRPVDMEFVMSVMRLVCRHIELDLSRGLTTSLLEAISVSLATVNMGSLSLDNEPVHH